MMMEEDRSNPGAGCSSCVFPFHSAPLLFTSSPVCVSVCVCVSEAILA